MLNKKFNTWLQLTSVAINANHEWDLNIIFFGVPQEILWRSVVYLENPIKHL